MIRDTQNTRVTVQVLVEGQLENRSSPVPVGVCQGHPRTLNRFLSPGDDGGHGQEIDPDSVPPVTVLLGDLVLVADPVLVPAIDGGRVVNTKNINVFNLESSRLDLTDNPTKRTRSVCAREDVFVHEKAPFQGLT